MITSECYMVSHELRHKYPPVKCRWIKKISSELCEEMGYFRLVPPLPAHYYNTASDIEYVVLAPKREGDKLFPYGSLPMPAYLCLPKINPPLIGEQILSNELEILDWVELISLEMKDDMVQ